METIRRKSLLYKSKVNYADHAINHVLGCAHGCLYPCYAFRQAQHFNPLIVTHVDWENPRIVENAMELLKKDLKRIGPENIRDVHMCFMTDPFMYDSRIGESFPEIEDLTLEILDYLWNNNVFTTTLTKGLYPIERLSGMSGASLNSYGITLVSLDEGFRKKYEPYSALLDQRIDRLWQLHEKGLHTWVSMEPFPTPNIDPVDIGSIKKLMDTISFVGKIVLGPWNYSKLPKEYGALDEPGKSRKFYHNLAVRTKQYCEEKGIEFYDKGEMDREGEADDKAN